MPGLLRPRQTPDIADVMRPAIRQRRSGMSLMSGWIGHDCRERRRAQARSRAEPGSCNAYGWCSRVTGLPEEQAGHTPSSQGFGRALLGVKTADTEVFGNTRPLIFIRGSPPGVGICCRFGRTIGVASISSGRRHRFGGARWTAVRETGAAGIPGGRRQRVSISAIDTFIDTARTAEAPKETSRAERDNAGATNV